MPDIKMMAPRTGRVLAENNVVVNTIDAVAQAERVVLSDSAIQQPVEIQSRFADIIQTHNAVSVGAGATSYSGYIQCVNDLAGAYSELAVTLQNSGTTASTVKIRWSNDGLTDNGEETILATGNDQLRAASTKIKGKFARIAVINGHSAAVTISTWAMLQA